MQLIVGICICCVSNCNKELLLLARIESSGRLTWSRLLDQRLDKALQGLELSSA